MCFFKLVNELEHFPPDAIFAQLPLMMRRMLLLKLPAVDVMKLESTSVVRGINMNAVWEKLSNQRLRHPLMLSDYPFDDSCLHYKGSWKEHYLAIVTSILLNLYRTKHELYSHSANGMFNLLFCYCNFHIPPQPIPCLPHPEYLILLPDRYVELQDTLETPTNFALFLMEECRYWPQLVYISCSLFFYSSFWNERDVLKVSSTLREFLSDTRQIVFSTDDKVMNYWDPDDDQNWHDKGSFHLVARYVMEVILSSSTAQLESLLTSKDCSVVMASNIIGTVCDLLCELDHETRSQFLPFHSSIPKKNLLKNLPYKHLKKISLSSDPSDSPEHLLDDNSARCLASAIETQSSLESVQLSAWPCNKHFMDVNWYDNEQEFTRLLSVLASLFEQPQFSSLELEVTSVSFFSLQEILHAFFTAMSPRHQVLKLCSVAIFQKNNVILDAFAIPGSNKMLNKSLHLSDMELTPLQEKVIFSCPLLQLDMLALTNLTSLLPSKSLGNTAIPLHVNDNSNLKTLVLKNTVFQCLSPQSIISLLLRSPNLTHLEVEQCDIDPGGLVTSLCHEVSNHSDLCVLKLVRNKLGRQSEHDFQQLCNAIFSLPDITKLSLDVSANDLTVQHFTILLDAWRQSCCGRKLRELVVSRNDMEPGLLPLAHIAHHVVL